MLIKTLKKTMVLLGFITVFYMLLSGSVLAAKIEKQDLKVLVIEINPVLHSIQNKKLYKNNNGHPKVSDFFGQDSNKAINELKEDLEFASHGYLNIIMKYEYLDEFPTYKGYIHDTEMHRFSEELYLNYCRDNNNPDKGNWYSLISNDVFGMVGAYSFDYDYLIEKFDLINRRNKGEFDQVWINSIDPVQTYETMMVGKNPYWINGEPKIADCNNFIIANISISRRDANLHALGHGVEGIMSHAFSRKNFDYHKSYNDTTEDDFKALNLWEQFSMTSKESRGNNSGIGNVHFPHNGRKDYDYENTEKVYSYWRNWLNYPDLSGKKELSNCDDWLKWKENTSLGDDQNKDPDRLYMRLWFYLFPHLPGVTEDGHYNNWWKYFVSLDYAEHMDYKFTFKKYDNVKKEISGTFFVADYSSGARKDISLDADFASFIVDDTNVAEITQDKKLKINGTGSTSLKCYVDGEMSELKVIVSGEKEDYSVVIKSPDVKEPDVGAILRSFTNTINNIESINSLIFKTNTNEKNKPTIVIIKQLIDAVFQNSN